MSFDNFADKQTGSIVGIEWILMAHVSVHSSVVSFSQPSEVYKPVFLKFAFYFVGVILAILLRLRFSFMALCEGFRLGVCRACARYFVTK